MGSRFTRMQLLIDTETDNIDTIIDNIDTIMDLELDQVAKEEEEEEKENRTDAMMLEEVELNPISTAIHPLWWIGMHWYEIDRGWAFVSVACVLLSLIQTILGVVWGNPMMILWGASILMFVQLQYLMQKNGYGSYRQRLMQHRSHVRTIQTLNRIPVHLRARFIERKSTEGYSENDLKKFYGLSGQEWREIFASSSPHPPPK